MINNERRLRFDGLPNTTVHKHFETVEQDERERKKTSCRQRNTSITVCSFRSLLDRRHD